MILDGLEPANGACLAAELVDGFSRFKYFFFSRSGKCEFATAFTSCWRF